MRKAILLAMGAMLCLAGCGPEGKEAPGIPVTPKWKGPAYHLAFDTKAAKPNPSGVTLPAIQFTANPDALEKRATLVVRFDSSVVKTENTVMNQVVLAPFDISGDDGALSADTIDIADKGLAHLFSTYCIKGKVNVSVLLARSSLNPNASDSDIDSKRLSDWLSTDVVFKNPHPGCKL
ncbi:MAG TPA: hypothetical protein VL991_08425 [Terracidiphilus sp.]|nr:hypothetical protein [Terracidiphilus sp.]